jgi:hypothetical protein
VATGTDNNNNNNIWPNRRKVFYRKQETHTPRQGTFITFKYTELPLQALAGKCRVGKLSLLNVPIWISHQYAVWAERNLFL